MTLNKEFLIDRFCRRARLSPQKSKIVLELLLEEIKTNLERGDEVKIPKFGKWEVQNKRAREGRNPNTGETVEISPRKVVAFRASEYLRVCVNREQVTSTGKLRGYQDVSLAEKIALLT